MFATLFVTAAHLGRLATRTRRGTAARLRYLTSPPRAACRCEAPRATSQRRAHAALARWGCRRPRTVPATLEPPVLCAPAGSARSLGVYAHGGLASRILTRVGCRRRAGYQSDRWPGGRFVEQAARPVLVEALSGDAVAGDGTPQFGRPRLLLSL